MQYTPTPTQVSKDLATFTLHNLLQEFYFLNDRLLQGDLTEKGVLKKAKAMLADEEAHLKSLPYIREVWLDAHIAYGGFLALSYRLTWEDGEEQKGYTMPVRK
jgi:hypothetical protein